MKDMNRFKNIWASMVLMVFMVACGNEPERILFNGPHFVFLEASANVSLLENSPGTLKIPVKVSLEQAQPVTVSFSIASSGAVAGIDYNLLTESPVTIPAGQYETFIEIEPINNDEFEPEERSFTVTLSETAGDLETQVRTSVKVSIINDDCPDDIPKIVNWVGDLDVEDDGFGSVPGVGVSGPDGSCGGVLIVSGDLLQFGLDARIILKFTQDAPGSTTGTVEVSRDRFFTDDTYAGYQYEAMGTYDEDAQLIIIDYYFYYPDGDLWFPGTHIITTL